MALSFLNAIVELVDMREGQLVFRSGREYPLGKQVQVRLMLPPGSGKLSLLTVVIQNGRHLDSGGLLYIARLTEESHAAYSATLQDPSVRASPRFSLGIRVMSKQLPGFWGLTVDLSRTGLQLEVDGPVPLHQLLDLSLEFDRFDLPRLRCRAEVMWCRALQGSRDNHHRTGVRFLFDDDQVEARINQVADFFEQRAQADLHELLEQAKLLHTEVAAAKPAAPRPADRRKTRRTSFVIPVNATITAMLWELTRRNLSLRLRAADGTDSRLEFPECQSVLDHACCQGHTVKSMRTSSDSKLLEQVAQRNGPGPWKHYQFLDEGEGVLLEVVSAPCQAGVL